MRRTLDIDEMYSIRFSDSPTMRKKVYEKVIEYCIENHCFSGETVQQSDRILLSLPTLMSEICDDIIGFEHVEKD